jgi:hypothetical protein
MSEELVFTVEGNVAAAAVPISLAQAGLRERQHLQEWVLAHPEILGAGVMIVTSEFDRWESRSGEERDRLDILGLADDGHLVVAELKRGPAPDTVEMQAIKYAASASRFDSDTLADAYSEFRRNYNGEALSHEEALGRLAEHTESELSDEALRSPRIVLVATEFPTSVTSTAVWLSEMGLDITLTRIQAYRAGQEIVVTVSQHYPPPDAEEFLVAPARRSRRTPSPALPEVEWTQEDFSWLSEELDNDTIRATLNLCSARPGEWISAEEVRGVTGLDRPKHNGAHSSFTKTILSKHFKRPNRPFQKDWAVGGGEMSYYMMDARTAEMWRASTKRDVAGHSASTLQE